MNQIDLDKIKNVRQYEKNNEIVMKYNKIKKWFWSKYEIEK